MDLVNALNIKVKTLRIVTNESCQEWSESHRNDDQTHEIQSTHPRHGLGQCPQLQSQIFKNCH